MKNKLLTVLMVLGMVGLLVGCSKLTKATLSEGNYTVTSTESKGTLVDKNGKDFLSYSIIQPVLEDKKELKFVTEDIEKYFEDINNSIYNDNGEIRKICEENFEFMSYMDVVFEYGVSFTVEKNDSGIISFMYEADSYTGGAHGETEYTCKNYDLANQKIIEFKDLFKDDYEEKLEYLIEEQIEAIKTSDTTQVAIYNNYKENINCAFDDDSFYFNGDSIVFVYNEYEIAPFSEGAIFVTIKLDALREYLNEEFLQLI